MALRYYNIRCHVTDQDLDVSVLALDEDAARELVAQRLYGIDHNVQWVAEA
jgi:hypothetical protein